MNVREYAAIAALLLLNMVGLLYVRNALADLSPYDQNLIQTLISSINAPQIYSDFIHLESSDHSEDIIVRGAEHNSLFDFYPQLQEKLSYVALGDFPTPIHYCENISAQFSPVQVYIKNDGWAGRWEFATKKRAYGGNKLRKLQYLLADAIAHKHTGVITFGCVGSNHAVQTAINAYALDLDVICVLKPQDNFHVLQKNLLLHGAYNTQLFYAADNAVRTAVTHAIFLDYKKEHNSFPYVIPVGGSVARGALGYVEAAFELRKQIDKRIMPQPDHIYVTLGSAGTAAGLLLGCRAAGITARLHCILDSPENTDKAWQRLKNLVCATNSLLHSLDSTFPLYTWEDDCCVIENRYTGTGYGKFTPEGMRALKLIQEQENIMLDGVYTSKCCSALLADLSNNALSGKTILFWNTFCGHDMSHITETVDYHILPVEFHPYFEQDVQALDV